MSPLPMPLTPAFSFDAPPLIPIADGDLGYLVRRIFCVGRNYAAHAAEMGDQVDRDAPFYFTKSPANLRLTGASIPYPLGSQDVHYEMECVVALGAPAFQVSEATALEAVYGYAAGIDLTRRDLQGTAKSKRQPWDIGKDFEDAAILGAITPASVFGSPGAQAITMAHNGEIMQDAVLSDMVWSVPEILAHLSQFYHLGPGDLIFTGTPAGVGPVAPGSELVGRIDGVEPVHLSIDAG